MSSEYTNEIENTSGEENLNIQLNKNYHYLMKFHISESLK